MSKSWNFDQAPKDRAALKRLRKPRDRRLKAETPAEKMAHRYSIKCKQFDLVLHSRGLVSPFDYEYPRLTSMSKLAKAMYEKHIAPLQEAWLKLEEEEEAAEAHQ